MVKKLNVLRWCLFFVYFFVSTAQANGSAGPLDEFFKSEKLTLNDAVLVVDDNDDIIYQWRPDESMVPASLLKLATAYLAIEKWGLEHTFYLSLIHI